MFLEDTLQVYHKFRIWRRLRSVICSQCIERMLWRDDDDDDDDGDVSGAVLSVLYELP